MVGLSIVLESHQKSSGSSVTNSSVNKKIPQVINKATMIINKPCTSSSSSTNPFLFPSYRTNLHSSSSSSSSSSLQLLPFLEHCFLCGQKLLPGKDIYMYKGDRGFCSVECRYRQIFMDEEDSLRKENCSLAAMKPTSSASSSSSSSSNSNSASSSRHHRKSTRNRAGGFAY